MVSRCSPASLVAAAAWLAAAAASLVGCSRSSSEAPGAARIWMVDDLTRLGGQRTTVWGAPQVADTERGRAVCFDGQRDGLVVGANPIEGLAAFTIEVLFRPDAGGEAATRFVHIAEEHGENRALIETRATPDGRWYLDTFLHGAAGKLTLARADTAHVAGAWYWAALSYADRQMRHYVNGVLEASGSVAFGPLGPGQTSLGVRLNQISWFKGCVRELRVSPAALPAARLQRP